MEDSARRYFKIVIGVIGAILSGALIVTSLKSGNVPGPGMAWWVTDSGYAAASHPSQYWFMLFLFVVGLVGFAWLAWHAYRNWPVTQNPGQSELSSDSFGATVEATERNFLVAPFKPEPGSERTFE